jgi:predicted aspartyl protease
MKQTSDLRAVVVPAEPAGRVLIVRAQIASGPEVRLVVDTGAGTSALGQVCANRLGLPVRRDLHVRTATGVRGVGTLAVRGLCVGPLAVPSFRLAVVPLPDDRVDGLLGLDFFRAIGARSVTLVLENQPRLEVSVPRRPEENGDENAQP